METKVPESLLQAVRYFADPDVAHKFVTELRWPNGVACPRMGCGNANVAYMPKYRSWYCKECKKKFTAKVGTIFEDSPIGFDKWLPAIWLLTANRNGISSCELARGLGVTQKTAWFILHRVRLAMADGTFEKLSGEVEADETWIGPKARSINRRDRNRTPEGKGRGPGYSKTPVIGIRERGGKVRAFVVKDNRRETLLPKIFEHVAKGSTIYTDQAHAYHSLKFADYVHHIINHAEKYVDGRVHTNSIENFWSVLKRTIGGTYICPRPQHLDRYLDEQIFRYNERENTDGPRFAKAVKGVEGKRLTYKDLTSRR